LTRWNSRGHRGDVLEDLISFSNEHFKKHSLARIDKVHIPIKVIEIDNGGMITKAFFEKKSTVDFQGIIQGIPVAFDVKETTLKSLPLQNIHEHQVEFMRDIKNQKGLSFIIIHFKFCDEYFLVPFEIVEKYYEEYARSESRKHGDSSKRKRRSIPYLDLNPDFRIERPKNGVLNYLTAINTYLIYKKDKRI
jgi:recombination protein U